ncbi:C-type lectin domain family 10 member A-like isoform X2 [Micropterus salmoides]|uniref:C-type lectin domain family 10 member A-like isoform X2 n=1 Tax=Micropterus salmoides TaxID=27706 RepID=UPI0018EB4248|nr:C-type lectin domain family 10 member A-like isoform X2 [Micropterus salmoides]
MAEGEVNYASVIFKTNKLFPPEAKKEEETVYNEVKVQSKTTEKTADTNAEKEDQTVYDNVKEQSETSKQTADINFSAGLLPEMKTNSRGRCYQQVACCLGILCVILLLSIIAVCVYITTLSHERENENLRREHNNLTVQLENLTQAYTVLKSNITNLSAENQNVTSQNTKLSAENQNLTSQNTKLSAENQNLTSQNTKLSAENQNLTSQNTKLSAENQNLTSQNTKLSAENQNLTSQNTKLSAENQNVTSQNRQLETRNQELQTERNNVTEQILNMEKKWNEFNVSRAQWSIDAYCPKENQNRQCKPCQDGWLPSQSSCYAINDPDVSGQKTWEEARENCRGKISDLVVIVDQTEKTFIETKSWSPGGYWIGLRAEDGKWKWVDGSVLTENSWIQQPATNGQCVISVQTEGWKSVSCGARNRWICKKKALSL